MNLFVMFGKVLELIRDENPAKCILVLEAQKDFRDNDGDYHNQLFHVHIWRGLYDKLSEEDLLNKTVMLKGRIEVNHNSINLITESLKIVSK